MCAHTVVLLYCMCDPQVVQWTQQTTTVGVLCSCCPTHLTVRGQRDWGEGGRKKEMGVRRRREGRRMVNGYIL